MNLISNPTDISSCVMCIYCYDFYQAWEIINGIGGARFKSKSRLNLAQARY